MHSFPIAPHPARRQKTTCRNPQDQATLPIVVDHTPATPADDRAIKLLERTPVPEAHKARLFALVHTAQEVAAQDGAEIQAEFGKEAVALIVGCNQFVRLFRGGTEPGVVEFLLHPADKDSLAQSYTLGEPDGAIFKMFGWVRVNPMEGEEELLKNAVRKAYEKARISKKPT